MPGRRIRVERGWDDDEGEQDGKSEAARRTVPVLDVLYRELAAQKLRTGRDGDALVFGVEPGVPFDPSTVRRRALAAWGWRDAVNPKPGGRRTVRVKARENALEPIGLHEARHTFASLMIAAGANAKVIQTVMGHATIQMTFDTYGHLMPGGLDEAAAAANAYLSREAVAT
jgi:integrase